MIKLSETISTKSRVLSDGELTQVVGGKSQSRHWGGRGNQGRSLGRKQGRNGGQGNGGNSGPVFNITITIITNNNFL
ncbi:MAG: hypothetical protein ABI895_06085 [Deltaproteobacteria bacterium]